MTMQSNILETRKGTELEVGDSFISLTGEGLTTETYEVTAKLDVEDGVAELQATITSSPRAERLSRITTWTVFEESLMDVIKRD